MKGAQGLLISITGGRDMTLFEVDEAATRIREEVDPDANIILGATFDEALEGLIRVSVVATGIDRAANVMAGRDAAPVAKPLIRPSAAVASAPAAVQPAMAQAPKTIDPAETIRSAEGNGTRTECHRASGCHGTAAGCRTGVPPAEPAVRHACCCRSTARSAYAMSRLPLLPGHEPSAPAMQAAPTCRSGSGSLRAGRPGSPPDRRSGPYAWRKISAGAGCRNDHCPHGGLAAQDERGPMGLLKRTPTAWPPSGGEPPST
jgi:cell division protein FtsZ